MNALQYSLIISVSAHAFLLTWLTLTVPSRNNRVSPIEVALMPPPSLSKSVASSPIQQFRQPGNRNQPAVNRKPLTSRNKGATGESLEELAPWSVESLALGGGIAPLSPAEPFITQGDQLGDIAIGYGSEVSAPDGATTGTSGAASGGGASLSDSASAPAGASVRGGSTPAESSRKSSTPSDIDSASGAVIPGYVIDAAGHRPPDAGAIYPEVDKYVLYGADKRTPINVLGTDVCIEGEFLRSKEAATIAEIKTDYSKCRYLDFGDESVAVKCPPEARTKIIHHNSYLSSPLVYSVRTCLEYDMSNCYLTTDQETEREMCRIDFQYEGLWSEGTKFFYRCSKSESRTYRQSLEYNIRWFMEVYIEERGLRRREALRETRAVPGCE
jgi:hypothetical protein